MFSPVTDIENFRRFPEQETVVNIKQEDIMFQNSIDNIDYIPFSTTSTNTSNHDFSGLENKSKNSENILSSTKAVVLDNIEGKVKIKLGNEMIVFFPKILFSSDDLMTYGRQLIYQIKLDGNGYRTQNFIVDEEVVANDKRETLLSKLQSL